MPEAHILVSSSPINVNLILPQFNQFESTILLKVGTLHSDRREARVFHQKNISIKPTNQLLEIQEASVHVYRA